MAERRIPAVPFRTATTRAFEGRAVVLGDYDPATATRTVTAAGVYLGYVLDGGAPGRGRWRAIDAEGSVLGHGLTADEAAAHLLRATAG